ncbi:MAG: SRPBCC family protein [Chloroflexi bacterium]|nr:SRPBCC family protein [Chloroflexota bacterium]
MARIDKEAIVNAPIEKVFGYLGQPSNWPEFWPSLIEVKDITSLPNGGYSLNWVYKMTGVVFKGSAEYTSVVPNQWLVIKTKKGINSTITWTFRSSGKRTKLSLTVEYKIPVRLLGKLAEIIVLKMNEKEADLMMQNITIRFMLDNS